MHTSRAVGSPGPTIRGDEMGADRNATFAAGTAGRAAAAVGAGLLAIGLAAGPAAAKGPKIVPASNLLVGGGSYVASVSAPRGTLPSVPNPTGGISGASIRTITGSAKITANPGTFVPTMIGSFVDDGGGALLPDGSPATALNPIFPVYPNQALARIKAVAADGSSAALTQPATGTGSGSTYVIAPVAAQVALVQGVGGLPFIVDVYTPITAGLCLGPLWGDSECGYDSGNLQWQTGIALATAGLDGSLPATAFTIKEGVPDGLLSEKTPGAVWAKYFDPDEAGPAPLAPWAVPAGTSGASERGCRPDALDRLIPNAGGVDYCVVNVVGLNAGKSTEGQGKPFSYFALPITWAASMSAHVSGADLVVEGSDFANDDIIVKFMVKNAKAKITGTTTPCPALNRLLTAVDVGPADAVGAFSFTIPNYAAGCTVPAGSTTKVQAQGSKDLQHSQIPGDPDLGTNLPKKASFSLLMP